MTRPIPPPIAPAPSRHPNSWLATALVAAPAAAPSSIPRAIAECRANVEVRTKMGDGLSPTRVMVCDDSATIRSALSRTLESEPGIRVVARVANGQAAIEEAARTELDVVILDIEMPVMDGMTALPLLLKADPSLRVIMASTLTTRGADVAIRALRLGAADYIPKPGTAEIGDDSFRRDLIAKVKGLGRLRQRAGAHQPAMSLPQRAASPYPPALLAIGSSTGGPQALFTLVQALGRDLPIPVVLTQHMPRAFTAILADHLGRLGGAPCVEAADDMALQPGTLYLAPGDRHLLIAGAPNAMRVRLSNGPPENYCRPSVDPMLRSAVALLKGRVLVAMLTGMGHDGLAGTRMVVDAGGTALAQDEATSVVWGMPGAIVEAGLCHRILPLTSIAPALRDLMKGRRT